MAIIADSEGTVPEMFENMKLIQSEIAEFNSAMSARDREKAIQVLVQSLQNRQR